MTFTRDIADERGGIAIILAITVVALIGLVALVVDIGNLTEAKTQVQSAADAASLAGMQEKLHGGSVTEILAMGSQYTVLNDFARDRGTPLAMTMVADPPDTEVGSDYFRVTVSKPVRFFFAPIFEALLPAQDFSQGTVRAQALSRRVFVVGLDNVAPWGATTIRPERLTASVAGVDTELSYNPTTDAWEGTMTAPGSTSDAGFDVNLTILNSQSYPEVFQDVGSIFVRGGDSVLSGAYLEDPTLEPGGSTYIYITASEQPTRVYLGNNGRSVEVVGANLFRARIDAPSDIDGTFTSIPIDVTFSGNQRFDRIAHLVVREPTHPVTQIRLIDAHVAPGGSVSISVKMQTFVRGLEYDLKVVSDPESGNFNALDFRYITHPDGTEHGLNSRAADYYPNLEFGYPGTIHIGDVIQTKTGNLSAPQTEERLDSRFALCEYGTYAEWLAAGEPACTRIVLVPIVERIERTTGVSEVVVIQFGAFFVTQYESAESKTNVRGMFVGYARPGEYTTVPPDSGLYIETSRLEMPNF